MILAKAAEELRKEAEKKERLKMQVLAAKEEGDRQLKEAQLRKQNMFNANRGREQEEVAQLQRDLKDEKQAKIQRKAAERE